MTAQGGTGVYHGVRVLELATGLAGPYAAMFLADNGADVVKVEPPGGDPYRADPGFQTVNRNKRSIVLDGDTAAAAAQRRRLIEAAEVILIDRPGQAATLRAVNPGAVIVTLSPWGDRGPHVAEPPSASLLHAACGMAWNQQSYGEVPVHLVVPLAQYAAGVLGALAAASGLLLRATRGTAATYEVSEVAGAAALQIGESRPAGIAAPIRPGDSAMGAKGRVACYRLIEAGDGQWLFLACGTERFYRRLLEVIGRLDLLDDPALANPPWGLVSDEAIARLTPILDEVFASKPRAHWLEVLTAADVPVQPVQSRDAFLRSSIVAANEMDVALDHPELGPVQMMGHPVTVDGAPGVIQRHAPLLGQHSRQVLDEWLPSRPAAGPAAGPLAGAESDAERPLAGIRVLDLSSFIAGPVVSRHLAMLGADVIKVEPPSGDPFRAIGPMFLSWNQGKRSIAVDLASAEGRRTVQALAARADVVVENFRPGVAERLGVDRASLAASNPDLVVLTAPGFGTDQAMAERPAFDPLLQALGGLMAAQGGVTTDPETGLDVGEPVFVTVPIHDVMTPLLGALGIVMGLQRRHHHGGGQHVRTSLAQATMAAQAAEHTRYAGRPEPASGGFDHPGPDSTNTWTEADDGTLWWHDGERTVEICRSGLSSTELAEANGLLTTIDHPVAGRLIAFGQLIGGAGPAPGRPPLLDEHGTAIRAELERPPGQTSS